MPPKNMISVTRKSHMPSCLASCCCSAASKWCATECASSAKDGLQLLQLLRAERLERLVVVGVVRHDRRGCEVLGRGRRRRLPFEAGRTPGVCRRERAVAQRPEEVA